MLCYLWNTEADSERLLMLHRSKAPNSGRYSPIGGKVEISEGESPHECAIREIHEEAGLDPLLTLKAIVRTCDKVLQSDTPDAATQLGPEDVRWLKLLRAIEVQDQQQE